MHQSVDWFDRLPEPVRKKAMRYVRKLSLRKEKVLYYQEDPAGAAYVVVSGEVRLVKWRTNGTSFLLGKTYPGDWLGLPEAVLEGSYLSDAISVVDSELAVIQAADIAYLVEFAEFRMSILRELASGYYPLHDTLESNTPDLRIAHQLFRMLEAAPGGDSTTERALIVTTQEELAEATGLSRETVNKHLASLQKDGVIQVSRGRIVVLRPDALRSGKEG